MSLSSDLREFGLGLGYDRVGFTTADRFPVLEKELGERRRMYDWIAPRLLAAIDPVRTFPEAKSIIVFVQDCLKHSYPDEITGKVGRHYQSTGGTSNQQLERTRQRLLKEFLESRGCRAGSDDPFLQPPPRLAGARSGVTSFGKNCFAFSPGSGSFIMLRTVVIDKELEYDAPTHEVRCPDNCSICIDSCPTGALYEPLHMNPLRCVAFNSYSTPGSPIGIAQEVIPVELRAGMGSWVYGCDVCQQVCPRNQARLKAVLPPNAYLEHISGVFRLDRLLFMSDEEYATVYKLLRYIKDKRYYRRNAAVALGNRGSRDDVPILARAMADPDGLVRGHVAWALGEIGGNQARRVLESSLVGEISEYVTQEIKAALAKSAGV